VIEISLMSMFNPQAVLISEPSAFSVEVVKKLEKDGCRVIIFSTKKEKWAKELSVHKLNSIVRSLASYKMAGGKVDYLIILNYPVDLNGSKENLNSTKKTISLVRKITSKGRPKVLWVFPYWQSDNERSFFERVYGNIFSNKNTVLKTLFVGDVIDSRVRGDLNLSVNQLAQEISLGREFYPLSVKAAAAEVVRGLFSLGVGGERIAILTKPIGAGKVKALMKKYYLDFGKLTGDSKNEGSFIEVDREILLEEDGEKLIKKALIGKASEVTQPIKQSRKGTRQKKLFRKFPNFARKSTLIKPRVSQFVMLIAIAIFTAPLGLLLISYSLIVVGREIFFAGHLAVSKSCLNFSINTAAVAQKYSKLLMKVPLIGGVYLRTEEFSAITIKLGKAGTDGLLVVELLVDLPGKLSGDVEFNLESYSDELYFQLGKLYEEAGFLQAEVSDAGLVTQKVIKIVLREINFEQFREKILGFRKLTLEISSLLGKNDPVVYMFLFQDKTIQRATGGIIDSFGLVTIDSGKIIDYRVFDHDWVDNNIEGKIEPPLPLKKYGKKESWLFRDSNWDPDFPTTAQRVEWFLEKGLDISIDGVIAFDIALPEQIAERVGRFGIEDFDDSATSKKIKLAEVILEELSSKNLQVFLSNKKAQAVLSNFNWDGGVRNVSCGASCYSDLIGLVSVNIDDISQNVAEEAKLFISIEEGLIKRNLVVYIQNIGDGSYRSYLRVLANADSGFGRVEVTDDSGNKEELEIDIRGTRKYKEAGIIIEIQEGEAKAVSFSWEGGSVFEYDNGKYVLNLRKQAGAQSRSVDIMINTDKGLVIENYQPFTLTDKRGYTYNTSVSRDKAFQISWQGSGE
jgi:hypothetical protein